MDTAEDPPLTVGNVLVEDEYKKGLKTIHSAVVAKVVAVIPPNRVLNIALPEIAAEEANFPRSAR